MKRTCLFLILLTLAMCLNEYYNVDQTGRSGACEDGIFQDIYSGNEVTLSDCADRKLTASRGLYDKCCYYRMMINGKSINGCLGLYRNETMDVPGYIDISEKQLKDYMRSADPESLEILGLEMTEGTDVKIYSIDCEAYYTKFFISVYALFCLFF